MSFIGSPTGIDVRKVVETGILPVINTGIAHKEPGYSLVGANSEGSSRRVRESHEGFGREVSELSEGECGHVDTLLKERIRELLRNLWT